MPELVQKDATKDRKDESQGSGGWPKAPGEIPQEHKECQNPKRPVDVNLGPVEISQVKRFKHAWIALDTDLF